MASPAHRTAVRYAMAILAVAVVLLVKCAVPALSDPPLPLFLGAVLFSAWFGGVGPGLFATLLALAAADFFFIQPLYSISLDRWGADAAPGATWRARRARRRAGSARTTRRSAGSRPWPDSVLPRPCRGEHIRPGA